MKKKNQKSVNLYKFTYRRVYAFLLVIMGVWSLLFYYAINYEVIDETDDMLENQKSILIRHALENPEFMKSGGTEVANYRFGEIPDGVEFSFENRFYDTQIFVEIENEFEPVRVLETAFIAANGKPYSLRIIHSTIEQDDLFRAILLYIIALFLAFLILAGVIMRLALKQLFSPLDNLIKKLDHATIESEIDFTPQKSQVREFQKLSLAISNLHARHKRLYESQKRFIENASHELQTPLAVVRTKLEILAEKESENEAVLQEVGEILQSLDNAVKLNKSMLLLSRIENGQFPQTQTVEIHAIVRKLCADFQEIFAHKNIDLTLEISPLEMNINPELARILLQNLIKNAFSHASENSNVKIICSENGVKIFNDGDVSLEKEHIFDRFYIGKERAESTGLGLAIAKSIAQTYGFSLTYDWQNSQHIFSFKKN